MPRPRRRIVMGAARQTVARSVTTSAAAARHERRLFAYEMVLQRNLEQDQMLWQTPTLALTAQAFLLTIALGHDSSTVARYLTAGLGVVVAVLSMQLMAKHRWLGELDAVQMRVLEKHLGLPEIADRGWAFGARLEPGRFRRRRGREYLLTGPGDPRSSFPRRRRSHIVWQVGLGLFGLTNVAIIVVVKLHEHWLR